MKICIISVWFGQLPDMFKLWLKTCEKNKKVDFIIISDTDLVDLPKNVKSYYYTLDLLKKSIENKLQMQIVLDRPYKCVDYKPTYGFIFSEYLENYDYWGYCDMDLLFGDIYSFAEKYELDKYDKFLTLGHLSLIRNTDECNKRFMLDTEATNGYKSSFTTNKITNFDELGGINGIYKENNFPLFTNRIYADISSRWKRIKLAELYYDSNDKNYDKQMFYWKSGKVYRTYFIKDKRYDEEYIYIHFKRRNFKAPDCDINVTSCYYITPKGFIGRNSDITINDVNSMNPFMGILYEWVEARIFYYIKSYYKALKKKLTSI